MASIERFEDLKSWQLARELSKEVYSISNQGAFAKDFDLKSQIRRASGSIMDNIAEGFERNGKGELIQFISIAKGSAGEVRSQLYRAVDNGHIDQMTFLKFKDKTERISQMLANFMAYLRKSEVRGIKYAAAEELLEYAHLSELKR